MDSSVMIIPCPRCGLPDAVQRVSQLSQDPAAPAAFAAPVSPRVPGRGALGCRALAISLGVGIAAAVLVGVLTIVLAILTQVDTGATPVEAGSYIGIVVFMVAFVIAYAIFVYRQVQSDVGLRRATADWHETRARWERLLFCTRCEGVFRAGSTDVTPPSEIQALLKPRG